MWTKVLLVLVILVLWFINQFLHVIGPLKIPKNLGLILTCYMLSVILMPVFLFLCLFFYLLKSLLNICLKIIYGNKYLGLFQGCDSIWVLGVPHEAAIDAVLIFTLNSSEPKDIAEEFKKIILTRILTDSKRYPKLTSTIHRILGYGYYLHSNCKVDEIVSMIEIKEDSDDYSKTYAEVFSKCGKNKLPANDTFSWEIVTLVASTSWKTKQNLKANQYPVLFRVHHVVGDGMSLAENLIKIFSDEPVDFMSHISESTKLSLPKQPSFVEKSLYFLHMVMLTPGFLILRQFRGDDKADVKIFVPSSTSGIRDLIFANDDSGTAIETIKRIKRKVGDTSFMEIIFTVVSRSLQNCFNNAQLDIPDIAVQILPFIRSIPNSEKPPELKNNFALFRYPIPILVKADSFVQRLNEVKKFSRSAKDGIDVQVRYFCWNHLCDLWSAYFILPLDQLNAFMGFTNIPACPKLTGMGFDIDHIHFVPPHNGAVGLFGSFLTYDKTLHISIGIDTSYFKSPEHSRKIATDILENIKLFDEEVSKLKNYLI